MTVARALPQWVREYRPATGLEGMFSRPHVAAAALFDDYPGFDSFTDDAVRRPAAQTLVPYIPYEGQET
ncbi:hypothetical protein ACIBW9_26100 [Streptomyces sp. NPDC049541]|uniref:hypothetical protein n=1 Tax=Streptomyces sp. NPDC049541 TaxID=3365594 RepID=UPI00378BE890